MGGTIPKLAICQTPHLVCWNSDLKKHRGLNLSDSIDEVLAEYGPVDYQVAADTYEDAPDVVRALMKAKGYALLHTSKGGATFRHYTAKQHTGFRFYKTGLQLRGVQA